MRPAAVAVAVTVAEADDGLCPFIIMGPVKR